MAYQIGQEVEYIGPADSDGLWKKNHNTLIPQHNTTYTIREVRKLSTDYTQCVLLREMSCGINRDGVEWGIPLQWIRPLQKKKDETFWTTGAPKDTEQFDNRYKKPAFAKKPEKI